MSLLDITMFFTELYTHLILIVGIVGVVASFLMRFLPIQFLPYTLPIRYVSMAILCLGIFLEGSLSTEKEWQAKLVAAEARVEAAEAKSRQTNTIIKDRIIVRTKTVKESTANLQKEISTKKPELDLSCQVSKDTIGIINRAAKLHEKANPENK